MEFEWDEEKRERNIRERGLDFADVGLIDFTTATTIEDNRTAYGERRYLTYGLIAEHLHVVFWTDRLDTIRIISFQKANDREQKAHTQSSRESPAADG